jgi:hypothetical protein
MEELHLGGDLMYSDKKIRIFDTVIAIIWLNQKVAANKMGPKDEYD